jgi:hypothetical protein
MSAKSFFYVRIVFLATEMKPGKKKKIENRCMCTKDRFKPIPRLGLTIPTAYSVPPPKKNNVISQVMPMGLVYIC